MVSRVVQTGQNAPGVTRIVANSADLRHGARTFADGAVIMRLESLRLRSQPMPEMPAGVRAAVAASIDRSSTTLDRQVLPMAAAAADLERRAVWTDIAGLAGFWPDGLGWLRDNGSWAARTLGFFGPGGVLPTLLATAYGYRFIPSGDYVNVRGTRFAGEGLLARYLRSGRLAGTRYGIDNPAVAKAFRLGPALGSKFAEVLPMDARFIRAAGKGSGPIALALTFGGDVYDFTLGPEKGKGLASTDFAATTITDATILGGTAAVSTGAGVAAAAGTGAMFGSVVPGVGTVVGFAVAGGVAYFLTTSPGKAVRSAMISSTKSTIEFAGQHPMVLAPMLPGAAAALEIYDHGDDIVNVAGDGLHYAGEGLSTAGKGLADAGKLVGGLFH
jgi:hypothetical protein